MINLLKETSNGQKQKVRGNLGFTRKKKTLTLCSNLELAGGDVVDDLGEDE
jgi:hypothetical protein